PAELLDQPVVAAAAADLRLGAERVADEGEDRPRVVIEADGTAQLRDMSTGEQRPADTANLVDEMTGGET
ncbi:MAG TPA: hypothetical protein VHM66_08400, partial [Solirubrobacterales bacterium]|nr:hypothetical protein [Solirubrobacterales bacterium]